MARDDGFSAEGGDAGSGIARREREAWGAMRYSTGEHMERGDLVEVEGTDGVHRILGYDLGRRRVLLAGVPGGTALVEPSLVRRAGKGGSL